MNDRHLPGSSTPAAPAPDASYTPSYGAYDDQQGGQPDYAGHDGYATGTFGHLGTEPHDGIAFHGAQGHPADQYDTGQYDTGQYDVADPYGMAAHGQTPYGTGQYDTGQYDTGSYGQAPYDSGDYGTGQWGASGEWDLGAAAERPTGQDTGGYPVGVYQTGGPGAGVFAADPHDSGAFATGAFGTGSFDTTGFDTTGFGTGSFATTGFDTTGLADADFAAGGLTAEPLPGGFPATGGPEAGAFETGGYATTAMWGDTDHQYSAGGASPDSAPRVSIPAQQTTDAGGEWDLGGHPGDTGQWDTAGRWGEDMPWEATGVFESTGVDTGQTQTWDATAWATGDSLYEERPAGPAYEGDVTSGDGLEDADSYDGATDHPGGPDASGTPEGAPRTAGGTGADGGYADAGFAADEDAFAADPAGARAGAPAGEEADDEPVLVGVGPRRDTPRGRRGAARPRTRSASRPKRSALLTVAVPSVAIMGVTAVAAAAVSGMGGESGKDDATTQAAPDTAPVKPSVANSKLDTQLAGLSDRADDFADRASRTQERIDLKERQAAERKRKAEEAARKEAMRPKFALPVTQHGLSAQYGQSGLNWMSLHTGIDFPVGYGTPVMAATDGTVRTQWNSAYGNMAIVTSPDGTETWYCHLSTTKIRSGSVKAGDVIAYSGDSGNSTGPHLHFEVRPGGGSAIDPLTWLRSHGLDPT